MGTPIPADPVSTSTSIVCEGKREGKRERGREGGREERDKTQVVFPHGLKEGERVRVTKRICIKEKGKASWCFFHRCLPSGGSVLPLALPPALPPALTPSFLCYLIPSELQRGKIGPYLRI